MDIGRVYASFFVQYIPFLGIWDFFLDFLLDTTVYSTCIALGKLSEDGLCGLQ